NVEGKFVDSTVKLMERVNLECIYQKKSMIIQTSWMKLNVTHRENIAVLHAKYGLQDNLSFAMYLSQYTIIRCSIIYYQETVIYCLANITYKFFVVFFFFCVCFSTDAFEVSERQNNPMFTKPGGNVTFTCPYKIGDSVEQVMWERIKADRVDTIVLCTSSGKKIFGSDFKERTRVNCPDQASSMIIIQNITASDFATYRCVATGRNKTYVMSFTVV
ncbi:CD226 protein, partial [Corythaeola cristata]|nr:CD226 protein [Corythaeola cristata]